MELLKCYNELKFKSDKETRHKYISNFYDKKFSKIKNCKLKILEIGVSSGKSLLLWENFFKNAEIFGVDIEKNSKFEFPENVKIYQKNAYDLDFIFYLKSKYSGFDIIIDDGSHFLYDQIFFCKTYKNILNKNGILIVEDVFVENKKTLKDLFPEFEIVDLMHITNAFNDNIIFYYEKKNLKIHL